MYMNLKTFELRHDYKNAYVEVDDLIAPSIQLLNQKNYITSACCSGHIEEDPSCAYIQFDFGEMTPEVLPEGWYWEEDGLMYYEYLSTEKKQLEMEIHDTMRKLYEWAWGLPDAH